MSYTILNESGEQVTTSQEVRNYFRGEDNCIYIGGSRGSYILLTTADHEAIEIVAEFLLGDSNELNNTNGDYWYKDEEDDNNSYCTFGDQFSIIEFWDMKKLKEETRKLNK